MGLTVSSGKKIDATIMEVPKQRNTREEKRREEKRREETNQNRIRSPGMARSKGKTKGCTCKLIYTIGLERATANIALKNIVYNLHQTIKLLENKQIETKFTLIF